MDLDRWTDENGMSGYCLILLNKDDKDEAIHRVELRREKGSVTCDGYYWEVNSLQPVRNGTTQYGIGSFKLQDDQEIADWMLGWFMTGRVVAILVSQGILDLNLDPLVVAGILALELEELHY